MKIFTKMAAVVLACLLAVPGEARVNVVYQRQDSLRIVGLLQQARAMKKKPARKLITAANQNGGKDNISVVLVEPLSGEVKEC